MGTNIDITVTNLLVALTQSVDHNVFRRAFAGATIHDIFNWLSVIILRPLEAATNFLFYMTHFMSSGIGRDGEGSDVDFLKAITKPLTDKIVMACKLFNREWL
jgi:sodium-dependent phosphate cotransporter